MIRHTFGSGHHMTLIKLFGGHSSTTEASWNIIQQIISEWPASEGGQLPDDTIQYFKTFLIFLIKHCSQALGLLHFLININPDTPPQQLELPHHVTLLCFTSPTRASWTTHSWLVLYPGQPYISLRRLFWRQRIGRRRGRKSQMLCRRRVQLGLRVLLNVLCWTRCCIDVEQKTIVTFSNLYRMFSITQIAKRTLASSYSNFDLFTASSPLAFAASYTSILLIITSSSLLFAFASNFAFSSGFSWK